MSCGVGCHLTERAMYLLPVASHLSLLIYVLYYGVLRL